MNYEFIMILKDYLFFTWMILLIPIGIMIFCLIISLAKRKWKIKTDGKVDKVILWQAILLALIIILGVIYTIPVAMDISQNSIEVEQYSRAYYYSQAENNGLFLRAILVEIENDSKIQLNDTKGDFPYEIEDGTIIYAKHSKIILEYTGTVIHQDSF